MTTKQTAEFIKKRVFSMALSARRMPHTASSAYAYMEVARLWACRNGRRELLPVIRDAKDSILSMGVAA